jgi:hypothetical protein
MTTTENYVSDEASFRELSEYFHVPLALAREAYLTGDRIFLKAYEYIIALMKAGKL